MQVNSIQNNSYYPKFGEITHPATMKEKTENYIKTEPVKSAVIGGSSLLLLGFAVYKRKAITKFLKNLFQKEEKQLKQTPAQNSKPPEPHFTVGKENPEQLAKEHSAYIKSIEKEYIDIDPKKNKEKCLMGLKALQKYGSREDLKTLEKNFYDTSKDDDIIREYAKFVGKVGEIDDNKYLLADINEESLEIYSEKTIEEIMKTLKKLLVDKEITKNPPEYYFSNYGYPKYKDFEMFAQKFENNPVICENAKAIMRRVEADNPEYNPKHIS